MLGARCLASATCASGCVTTLADLCLGRESTVLGFADSAAPASARRLLDLGFAPGTQVSMVRAAPWRDPVIFRLHGCEITLRRRDAAAILVAA